MLVSESGVVLLLPPYQGRSSDMRTESGELDLSLLREAWEVVGGGLEKKRVGSGNRTRNV